MRTILCCAGLLAPLAVHAQVGHAPNRSPYRDLEFRQELTFLGGYYDAAIDPVRVAPRNGAALGAHYEIRLGGPVYFYGRSIGVLSQRTVINPALEIDDRVRGDRSVPFLLTDVGISLNLTGFKSWHGLIPVLGGGGGVGTSFEKLDVGGYRFGFPLVLATRPGIKFAPGGKWAGRIDFTNYFYRIRYPDTYFVKSGADDPVLTPGVDRDYWKRNLAITVGMTRTFGR